jgi:hypothetical protein
MSKATRKKTPELIEEQSAEAVEIVETTSAEPTLIETIIEPVEDNTQGVTVQAHTAPASGILKAQGVYIKSKLTKRIIAGPIDIKMARQQVKEYPNRVEIVEENN